MLVGSAAWEMELAATVATAALAAAVVDAAVATTAAVVVCPTGPPFCCPPGPWGAAWTRPFSDSTATAVLNNDGISILLKRMQLPESTIKSSDDLLSAMKVRL